MMMPTIWSPTISTHTIPITLLVLPSAYNSPIQTSRQWHDDHLSEEGAQLEPMEKLLIAAAYCCLCGIGIGPDHLEQDLYIYPVYNQRVLCIVRNREQYIAIDKDGCWLLCCGGCAHAAKRMLPESYCLLDYRHWTTNLLIQEAHEPLRASTDYDIQAIWAAKDTYLTQRLHWFLMITAVSLGISVRQIFCQKQPLASNKKCEKDTNALRSSGFLIKAPTPMLAS